jgi:signal transduction histidine kinase
MTAEAITAPGAVHHDAEVGSYGDFWDWLLAAGLAALVWIQTGLPFFLHTRGFDVPAFPINPEGGPQFFGEFRHGPGAFEFLLVGLAFLPLGMRRRYPMTVLAVVTAANVLYNVSSRASAMTLISMLVAVYTVGTFYGRRELVVATVVTTALLIVSNLHGIDSRFWVAELIRNGSLMAVAAAVGDATRQRRAYTSEVEQRALDAERTHEEEAKRRVDEERLRIARELHDITAHSLSVIAVQSGAAVHVMDTKPEEARHSLQAIRQTSREALEELRGMVGVLRGEGAEQAPYEPSSGLSQVEALAEQIRRAGVSVDLDFGDLHAVPAVVSASAYRVIQEALTNVLRHAGPGAGAQVTASMVGSQLEVSVVDDGAGASLDWREGHGLTGMRERAEALGGAFQAGPLPQGGFWVGVTYPLSDGGVSR